MRQRVRGYGAIITSFYIIILYCTFILYYNIIVYCTTISCKEAARNNKELERSNAELAEGLGRAAERALANYFILYYTYYIILYYIIL